jgi:hypothetical protein
LRFLAFFFILTVIPPLSFAFVTESEPNNTTAQADRIQCGDTVYCAALDGLGDLDHFRFAAVAQDSIVVFTESCSGSLTNTVLVLFDDHDSLLAVNDNGNSGEFSRIRYRAFYTGDYVARVLRQSFQDSLYSLVLRCPRGVSEAYDSCSSPRLIASFPYYNEGSTRGMSDNCRGTLSPDVFYQFYNPVLSHLLVTVCSNPFDARVQLMSECCRGFLDDASEGDCLNGADIAYLNLPEGDYYLMVEGMRTEDVGEFSIEVNALMPGCPEPGPVVLTAVGGYPFLDWPEAAGPSYFIVWQCPSLGGLWEHLGATFTTYFVDSTGFSGARKFYRVSAVCPW